MRSWTSDLSRSAEAFRSVVWPEVAGYCGGGGLVPVEEVTATGFSRELDVSAGIDAWEIQPGSGIRGIASRVQWIPDGGRPWNTFTIRKSRDSGAATEYAKRLLAIEGDEGWLYPHFTIQAYLSSETDVLLSVAVCKTLDLICYIRDGSELRTRRTANAEFYAVGWKEYRRAGRWIRGHCPPLRLTNSSRRTLALETAP